MGVVTNGRPYPVLEHVAGKHIDEYCDERKLSVDDRVRLFFDVWLYIGTSSHLMCCWDFGIAKLLDGRIQERTVSTDNRGRRWSDDSLFAAPEQINGGEVATRWGFFWT